MPRSRHQALVLGSPYDSSLKLFQTCSCFNLNNLAHACTARGVTEALVKRKRLGSEPRPAEAPGWFLGSGWEQRLCTPGLRQVELLAAARAHAVAGWEVALAVEVAEGTAGSDTPDTPVGQEL